jgi:hypothetical protein
MAMSEREVPPDVNAQENILKMKVIRFWDMQCGRSLRTFHVCLLVPSSGRSDDGGLA